MMELIRNGDDPPPQDPSASTLRPFCSMGEHEPTEIATTECVKEQGEGQEGVHAKRHFVHFF